MPCRQDIYRSGGESSKESFWLFVINFKTQHTNLTLPRCFTSRRNKVTEDVCLEDNISPLASERGRCDEASYRLQVSRVT